MNREYSIHGFFVANPTGGQNEDFTKYFKNT
jgi:hypothetical protein